jgi:hypothetical protein
MTAIIAILNKSAVAVSADSAVTIGTESSRKVYNYANKVFNLSIGNPIGIMIYNNAEFCGIPWETIIKLYRRHTNNKSFPKVLDYREDFIGFLKHCTTKYFDGSEEDSAVKTISRSAVASIDVKFVNTLKRLYSIDSEEMLLQAITKLSDHDRKELFLKEAKHVITESMSELQSKNYHSDFSEQDITIIRSKYERIIKTASTEFLGAYDISESTELLMGLTELILQAIVKNVFFEPMSGLVFTGFGEDEIFPSLHAINVGCVINGKLRYSIHRDYSITQKKAGAIAPFAQTDIMQTFIEGIDPQLKIGIPSYLHAALNEVKEYVLSTIDGSTEAEKNLMSTLDKKITFVLNSLTKNLEQARIKLHISPMIAAISSLSKEDLAAMAESLINATYLHRRASFAEESVGGPVDVAIITKGDGFVWIKRKHYFDAALNLNYSSQILNRKI